MRVHVYCVRATRHCHLQTSFRTAATVSTAAFVSAAVVDNDDDDDDDDHF